MNSRSAIWKARDLRALTAPLEANRHLYQGIYMVGWLFQSVGRGKEVGEELVSMREDENLS